jgi:UV DNA damage endonuclease
MRLRETVDNNLSCLRRILEYNLEHGILFFRLTSDLIPFASHPVNTCTWQEHFARRFRSLGRFIRKHAMRISMHPDQFTLINSKDRLIYQRSAKELEYHAQILDLMGLPLTAKIQLHVGGIYGDKDASIKRFISRYKELPHAVHRRLVVENDDRSYSLQDCLSIHHEIHIPILFDTLHHQILNNGESIEQAIAFTSATWRKRDGLLMVDYSTQQPGAIHGKHAETLEVHDFRQFLKRSRAYDFDIMLEIKDKEHSALRAINAARNDKRFCRE